MKQITDENIRKFILGLKPKFFNFLVKTKLKLTIFLGEIYLLLLKGLLRLILWGRKEKKMNNMDILNVVLFSANVLLFLTGDTGMRWLNLAAAAFMAVVWVWIWHMKRKEEY